jgi:tetratricopeptide (TPR) repeat protein
MNVPMSSATPQATAAYEKALSQFQSYVGDPVATLDAALAEAPDFVSGHLFKALALFTTSEKQFLPAVETSLGEATRRATRANERERALMAAIRRLLDGQWDAASRQLDRVLAAHPRDAMTLQAAHLIDFFRGDALNLRNRISRVLPHWNESVPGYSYVLGMHAFGLEEMNQYAEAEATGRRALALEPRDAWAVHAVTHVMEMQGRIDDGIRWLESRKGDWAPENGFAFHNWWHLALFNMDSARFDRVLALYDKAIHPEPAQLVLSLLDATALLWRLHLEGVALGRRFEALADEWQVRQERDHSFYAFNDFHAMLAFAASGREDAMNRQLAWLAAAATQQGSNGAMTREVGLPLARGIAAFARAQYAAALDHLEPVRDIAQRFGGSHAQRDLITLTVIEAALRAKQRSPSGGSTSRPAPGRSAWRARRALGARRWRREALKRDGDERVPTTRSSYLFASGCIEGDCGTDERLECARVDLLALMDVDRAPCIPLQARVEELGRVLQRSALEEG